MSKIFISPCGTSLLTNGIDAELRQLLFAKANEKEADLKTEEKEKIAKHIQERREQLINSDSDLKQAKRLSAELNGIITYYEKNYPGKLNNRSQDIHYLIATDTYQGKGTANMVADWLQQYGIIANVKVIQDLATDNSESFHLAMSDLVEWCNTTIESYPSTHYELVFNLTGGFKSVNGFMQAIGMFYGAEIVYIFQSSNELLTIPSLPITFNTEEIIGQHLKVFRQLGLNREIARKDCPNIPETLLFNLENQVTLSEWGMLAWQQAKAKYYCQSLLEPLGDILVYSTQFKKDVARIQPDKLKVLNERLDQLWDYLESGQDGKNLKSLNFHPLTGKPCPPSTHECYIWSGQGERLYGHFEGKKYIIDKLGAHLK